MKTEKILVANLTCGAAEKSIQKSISEIEGVQIVIVDPEHEAVIIKHSGKAQRNDFTEKLHSIGYRDYIIV